MDEGKSHRASESEERGQRSSRGRTERKQVQVSELQKGMENSDSVRHLQTVLNKLDNLPDNLHVEVTGTYDAHTQLAVRWWQNNHGHAGGRGLRVSRQQANSLFNDRYLVID